MAFTVLQICKERVVPTAKWDKNPGKNMEDRERRAAWRKPAGAVVVDRG
jgi:hypothetical protein